MSTNPASGSAKTPQRPRVRVALAVLHEGQLLLVQHTKGSKSYWLLPGGGLEWGESLKDAAARELEEETGLRAEVGQFVLASETLAPDGSRHLVHMVFAGKLLGGEIVVPNNEERITDVRWIPLPEVGELVLHPPMQKALAQMEPSRLSFQEQDESFLGNLWID